MQAKLTLNHFSLTEGILLFLIMLVIPFTSGGIQDGMFGLLFVYSFFMVASKLSSSGFRIYKRDETMYTTMILSLAIISYSLFNMLCNGFTYDSFIRLIQLFTCLFVLVATAVYPWKHFEIQQIFSLIKIVILVAIVIWPLSGFETNYYSAMFTRGNALGGAIFCYLGIFLIFKRKYSFSDRLCIVLALVLLYFANSRSSLISLIVFLLVRYIILKFKNIPYKWLLYIFVAVCIAIPIVYMALFASDFKDFIDELSWQYFRKRFFSGRQYLWGSLLEYIAEKPFIGYGLNVTADDMLGLGWSSHNWYLQTMLQIGVIGLILVMSVIGSVWNTLYRGKDYIVSRSVAAFMIGVLLWQCFEVTITQNNISVGILVWFVFGLGANPSVRQIESSNAFMGDNSC